MLKRICMIVNYNLYESKRHFTQKLAEAMERKGFIVKVIDTKGQIFNVNDIVRFQADISCSFNSSFPNPNQQYFWDLIEIPHVSFLVDPAIYSIKLTNSKYSVLSCVDRFDCQSIKNYNFENVFFWPHAIERELKAEENQERPYDVVFLGSCHDYENLRLHWQEVYSPLVSRILDYAIEIALSDQNIPLMQALVTAWGESGISPEGVDFARLFYYLDQYTRGVDRVELIRSIKDAQVHVFGDLMIEEPVYKRSWSYYLKDQSNVTIHPAVPYQESLQILKQSKVSLNSMPFFKDGTHERVFGSLACGALPVTSYSTYLHENFPENKEMLYYKPSHWSEVNDQIMSFLTDEKKRKAVVMNGRKNVMAHHTWDNRVDQLLQELPPILTKLLG